MFCGRLGNEVMAGYGLASAVSACLFIVGSNLLALPSGMLFVICRVITLKHSIYVQVLYQTTSSVLISRAPSKALLQFLNLYYFLFLKLFSATHHLHFKTLSWCGKNNLNVYVIPFCDYTSHLAHPSGVLLRTLGGGGDLAFTRTCLHFISDHQHHHSGNGVRSCARLRYAGFSGLKSPHAFSYPEILYNYLEYFSYNPNIHKTVSTADFWW